jgi:hypothetical protein
MPEPWMEVGSQSFTFIIDPVATAFDGEANTSGNKPGSPPRMVHRINPFSQNAF